MKNLFKGLSAGIMIAVGCAIYLACSNKYIGAGLFSIALIGVCIKDYSLFTGKIGYIITEHKKENFSVLLLGLLGNAIAVIIFGLAISYAVPSLSETAKVICEAKLSDQNILQTFIRGVMCGLLMFFAVSIYKEHKNLVGILFAIPVFILAGFEHSIADIGYFAIANIYSWKAFGFIWMVILGNAIGSFILPLLNLRKKENETTENK